MSDRAPGVARLDFARHFKSMEKILGALCSCGFRGDSMVLRSGFATTSLIAARSGYRCPFVSMSKVAIGDALLAS